MVSSKTAIFIGACSLNVSTVVLYGRETWSPTMREGRRLKVFENRVLRRILGPKKDEITGE
jgi:dihydrofolate reductase